MKVNISKFHNSAQNYRTGTGLQHAQLGLVSIITVKFYEILTNCFQEIVFTKKCIQTDGQTDGPRESNIAPIYLVSGGIMRLY